MTEPTGGACGTPVTPVARQDNIGMGVGIASLIAFLVLAVGAFWAINGDTMTAANAHLAAVPQAATEKARKSAARPGQIGNVTERVASTPD